MTDIETIENSPQRMSMRHTHYREKYDVNYTYLKEGA